MDCSPFKFLRQSRFKGITSLFFFVFTLVCSLNWLLWWWFQGSAFSALLLVYHCSFICVVYSYYYMIPWTSWDYMFVIFHLRVSISYQPSVTTNEIDKAVHQMIIEAGAYPSPLGYGGFPKSVCTSVNECMCHGIPDSRQLQVCLLLLVWHEWASLLIICLFCRMAT